MGYQPLTETNTRIDTTNTKLDTLHSDNGAAGASPASGSGILGFLRSIYDKLASTLAVTQSGTWTVQPGNTANTTAWKVDGSATTQPVSDAGGSLTVDGTVSAGQSGTWTVQPGNTANTTPWKVDGSSVTQPVSAASLPLPSGAATAARQDTGNTSLSNVDTSLGDDATSPPSGSGVRGWLRNIYEKLAATIAVTQSGTWTVQPGNTANTTAWKVDASATTQPVSAASLPLPSGAATSAKQDTGNTSLGNIDTSLGADGTSPPSGSGVRGWLRGIYDKLAATIAVTQSGTWTVQPGNTANTTAWKVDGSAVTQPVSDAGGSLTVDGTVAATQSGTWTVQPGNTANTTPWKVDGSATTQPVSDGGGSLTVDGTVGTGLDTVAHDAVDSGNPVKVGGQARTTNPTAVADGDRTNFITDKLGKQVVVGSLRALKADKQTQLSATTAETTILTAAGAGVFLDLYGLTIANTSATACNVTIRDATAGSTRFVFAVAAGATTGFMLPESGGHRQASANNNWTAQCGTSVAAIEITAMAVQNL